MVTSVAVYFVTEEEFDTIREDFGYNFDFHSENPHMFQGYIDESYSEFQPIYEEIGLYKRAVYGYLDDHFKTQLNDIDYEKYFNKGIFVDYYVNEKYYGWEKELKHRQEWLDKFRNADQELYLLLEWH